MHGIYKVEEMLCDELEKIGEKNELTAGSLETADKLSHALKNVQKIIEYYESMGDYDGYSRDNGRSYWDGSYDRDGRGGRTGSNQYGSYDRSSYARGRGSNAKRDSRGRYSSRGYSRAEGMEDMKAELHRLMEDAPNAQIKQRMQELISEIDMM